MLNRYVLMAEAAAGDTGGGGDQVTVSDARTFLSDFVEPASLKDAPDADIIRLHGKVSAAVTKHAKTGVKPGTTWFDGFQNKDVKDWLGAFPKDAYPNAEAIATKAFSLEKFVGADKANRGIIIPKADAKPEEWRAYFAKAGVPEKPEGYKLPNGYDKDPMMVGFRNHAHTLGVPTPLFNGIMEWYGGAVKKVEADETAAWEAQAEKEIQAVHTGWSVNTDAMTEHGRRAARSFIPHENKEQLAEVLNKMEGALGTAFTMRFWANIGKQMGEHGFVMGEGGGDTGGGEGGMTPEAARVKIRELKADPVWSKKYTAGDADAKAEFSKLNAIGYPGKTDL